MLRFVDHINQAVERAIWGYSAVKRLIGQLGCLLVSVDGGVSRSHCVCCLLCIAYLIS